MQSDNKIKDLDLIEEITRLDGSKYFEIGNMIQNGRAELAVERGYLNEVRILQLNIPRSQAVVKYEKYISERYTMPIEEMDHWEEWIRDDNADQLVTEILKENHIA